MTETYVAEMGPSDTERGGTIYLAATPIGNAGDATFRLRDTIEAADIVAAEDTRRFRSLCVRLGLAPRAKVIALHDHNEAARAQWLVEEALSGKLILVVSDAGTPTVSDPGYHLVSRAAAEGVNLVPLPGPSAALAALSVAGLPTDRFAFEGFLPRKGAGQSRRLTSLAKDPRTLIFFESPRRTAATLRALSEHFGLDRPAALCRELTKTHEEVIRGTLGELARAASEKEVLGEITIVVGGATTQSQQWDPQELGCRVVQIAERQGLRLKDAAALVAQQEGLRKNQVMQAALDCTASDTNDH